MKYHFEPVRLLAAEKAQAEKFSQEHAKLLSLREAAIRELHLVRPVVETRVSKHTAAVPR